MLATARIDPRLTAALKDKAFLKKLDEYQHKVKYARITSLTWDENPIEQIQGSVTSGSLNLDGQSAVRRTCSLTLEAQAIDIHDYYWGLKTKFKLEIGLENVINSNYPDIIWFNQGIFIFTSFSSSVSPTGYTFSISGKDKMCLLDGSMGGNLPSSIDFGKEDIITYTYKELSFKDEPTYAWVPYEYIEADNINDSFNYMSKYSEIADIKKDGIVNPQDISYLRRAANGKFGITLESGVGDFDGDGFVTENDFNILRDFIVGRGSFEDEATHYWDKGTIDTSTGEIIYTCTYCGAVRRTQRPATPEKGPCEISISNISVRDSNAVVIIKMAGFKELLGCKFQLYYDRNLTLTNVDNAVSALKDLTFRYGPLNSNPIVFSWDGIVPNTSVGQNEETLLTLTFALPNDQDKSYPLVISTMVGEIYDAKFNPIEYTIRNRSIQIGTLDNSLTYNNFRFEKMVVDETIGSEDSNFISSSNAFYIIKNKWDRDTVKVGEVYYNKSKFPYLFYKAELKEDDSPAYCCFERDEVKKIESIPIKQIIKEAIHKYAKEPYHNIIINDLDITGQELLEYRGDAPCYLLYNSDLQAYESMTFTDYRVLVINYPGEEEEIEQAKNLSEINYKTFNYLEQTTNDGDYFKFAEKETLYQASRIQFGDTIGYREIDLIYAGELICNVGESLTSMLDKIKNMLGEYEYFYNVDGQFIFQRKQTYLNNSWNNIITDTDDSMKKYVMPAVYSNPIQYQFANNNLFTALNNNPQLSNIKNDFAVWGTRKTISGGEVPIHYRVGIQSKPTKYTSYNEIQYIYNPETFSSLVEYLDKEIVSIGIKETDKIVEFYNNYIKNYLQPFADQGLIYVNDWRELIYQMAQDYMRYGQRNDFLYKIEKYNPTYHLGVTGYEQYYEDMLGFWRDIYNPDPLDNIVGKLYTYYETIHNTDHIYDYKGYKYEDIEKAEEPYTQTSSKKYHPDFNLNMNYSLIYRYPKANEAWLPSNGCYLPQRKKGSFDILYNYVKPVKPQNGKQYYCQSVKGAKAYLQLLSGEKITVLDKTGKPQFEIYKKELNDKYYESQTRTYKWKNLCPETQNTDEIWFLIEENGWYKVIVCVIQNNEYSYKHAYSYYKAEVKSSEIFYTSNENGRIDPSDIYYDDPHEEDFIEWTITPRLKSSIEKIPHTTIIKEIEKNKTFDGITHFNVIVNTEPELLNFWFDLIDPNTSSEFYNYKIESIGVRSKAITDSGIKAIYYKETPNIMFINKTTWESLNSYKNGYTYIQIPDYYINYFSVSSQGKSAKDAIDDLLYQFTSYNESITITGVPIYYLPLNSLIQITDKTTDINGDYIVNKISLPLAYNGTMTINASKAIKRIF